MTSARVTTGAPTTNTETYPLEGGAAQSTYVGLGLGMAVEGVVLHLAVARTHPIVGWAFTVLNVAGLIWIWRSFQAQKRSTFRIGESDVEIAFGAYFHCRVPRSTIASVERATWRSVPALNADYVNAARLLEPNVTIVLGAPVYPKYPFGITRRVSRIDLRVADPDAVIAGLSAK